MANQENEPELSIAEAQQIAGVSRRTIYHWLHAGKVKYRRTAGGSIRIFRASLFTDVKVGEVGAA